MTNKRAFYIVTLSLFLFSLPSLNMLDVFPDFIGCFLLYALLSRGKELVPYLAEAANAALKLGFVTLARLPATVIMYANMYTGRDIVPLFTLVFAVIESVLLFILITNAFEGLFYIAERTEASAILKPISLFKLQLSPERIRSLTLIFAFSRAVLNVLPELCLLSSQNADINRLAAILYPILLCVSLLLSLIIGIIWLVSAIKYTRAICRGVEVRSEVLNMAGEEKLATLRRKKQTSQLTNTLTVLAVSGIFTVDIILTETSGVNILPHFIYGLILLYCVIRLFSSKRIKIAFAAFTACFTAFGLLAHVFTINFFDKYTMLDIYEGRGGVMDAYIPIEVFSLFEGVMLLCMLALMAYGMRGFLFSHTGITPGSEGYSRADRDRHRSLIIRGYFLFGLVGASAVLKVVRVFTDANVKPLFTQTGMIMTSSMPWLLWVGVVLSIAITIYSFLYLSDVRGEVKFKYADDEKDNRRGRFE